MAEKDELSERELEILRLVATGASNKDIAQQLYISPNTVKVHLKNIFGKIGAASRTEAAMYAVRVGLVQDLPAVALEEVPPGSGTALAPEAATAAGLGDTARPAERSRSGLGSAAAWSLAGALLIVAALLVWAIVSMQGLPQAAASTPAATDIPRWQTRASLAVPRRGLGVAVFENALYAIGGEGSNGVLAAVERFDPAQNRWTALAEKPQAVADISAALVGGKIYVPGGRLADGRLSRRLEVYDPAQDRWSQAAQLPFAVSAYGLAAFEGKLYLFGGWNGSAYLDSVLLYDPDADAWEQVEPMPTRRGYLGVAVAGSKIYVLGGYDGEEALAANEIFQPNRIDAGQAWSRGADMPDPRYAMGVTTIADIIEVLGGLGGNSASQTAAAMEYLPQRDSWQSIENPVLRGWSHLGVAPVPPYLYVVGGLVDGSPTGQNLAYQAIYTVIIPVVK